MDKNWTILVRDDFRLVRNDGLAEATNNHDEVVVTYTKIKYIKNNKLKNG